MVATLVEEAENKVQIVLTESGLDSDVVDITRKLRASGAHRGGGSQAVNLGVGMVDSMIPSELRNFREY